METRRGHLGSWRRSRHVWPRLIAVVSVVGLVAGACSSGGNGERARGGGASARREGSSECTFKNRGDGGKVVYGVEADTGNPWTPANAQMAISGHMVAKSVYDTLTLLDTKGDAVPNLAESWSSNADFTEWTFTIRSGVTFHDGTPLDGAAVADNLNRLLASFLTQNAVRDIGEVSADGQTVTITLKGPFSQLPKVFSTQLGYVASPKWLAAVDEDPTKALQPVGTGAFKFKSYTPGNGNSYVGECNPEYWREGLPRLDEIEFRVLEDIQSRANALISGEVDAMHTSNADEIAKFRERTDQFSLREITDVQETAYVLLNNSPEVALAPGGEAVENPVADVRVRRALAFATDNQTLIDARGAGIVPNANGPFPTGSMGYLDDTGYPDFDLDAAKRLVAEYEAEKGDLKIAYATTSDPFNRVTAEILKEMWEKAGISVSIDTVEQSQFIFLALGGNFQAFGWRNHGRPDPVLEDLWWSSETAIPSPGIALNFGRINDPVVDENLRIIRESNDPATRTAAAEALNRRFGEQAFNLWNSWVIWAVVTKPGLEDITSGYSNPDGTEILQNGQGLVGSHFVSQAHWAS
ncbi:MAG: ABC transporter substrate-binding protein [Actinobacteria bacterium]|nr:ABC transporter substrate-binding protein [Actinomycetota bacterium]